MVNYEHNDIAPGILKCNKRCRKCNWYNNLTTKCDLKYAAILYIKKLEEDNSKKIIYCKDCIYCKVRSSNWKYDSPVYECKNRDGLHLIPGVQPMDYCSQGQAVEKKELNNDEEN